MKMKDIALGIFQKALVISVILLLILSLAIMPTPYSVVRGATAVDIELEAGWNYLGLPESISASDLALKSNSITSIVHRTSDGYYESYIPSLGATDFICEPNEAIYIYSNAAATITFTISESAGDISGDLFVTGDTILNKNLTVNGSMSVVGDLEVNSLNVTEDLTIDGDLTVHEDLAVGEDLTVSGNLVVGEDLTVGDLTITEDMTINDDLTVAGDATIDGDSTVVGDMDISGNLTASNFTVGNLTIAEDLEISGNLSVTGDSIIGGDSIVAGDMVVGGSLIAGDFTVGNLTIEEDLAINGNLSITGDTMIDGDAIIVGNLTAGDFTVDMLTIAEDLSINGNLSVTGDSSFGGDSAVTGDMSIDGNLTVNGTLSVDIDVQVGGNLSVVQDTTIGGYLTVTGNATFEQDLTVNGNLTVFNLVSNIVSEKYVVGNLTVTGNVTGLVFTETADYLIFIDSGVVYAKNGKTGNIDFQSTNATYVIQSAIDAIRASGADGGKIFIQSGLYELPGPLIIEDWRDPKGTIMIEGAGYSRTTKLKLTSTSILPTFVSLKGSEFIQLRNLAFDVNNKANYGIRMERNASGQGAGYHKLENIFVANAKQVGILDYGSEGVYLENVVAQYGNPVGMLVTAYPPAADPTVKGTIPVNRSGTWQSTTAIVMDYCKWGHSTTTTRAGLIVYGAQIAVFGGLSRTAITAEANFIIDETSRPGIFDGITVDVGNIGFKIGGYPSGDAYPNTLMITGLNLVGMNGTNMIEADYLKGSTIMGVTTTMASGKITLSDTTERNFVAGFTNTPSGEYLTVEDNGIGNSIYQATVTIGNDLKVNGNLNVIGDLSVSGSMEVTGNLTVAGDIIGATGRTASYVVVASDAPTHVKNQADWVCDGTNDHIEIQAALDNCSTGGGKVSLSEGIYNIESGLKIGDNTTLSGVGSGTILFVAANRPNEVNGGWIGIRNSWYIRPGGHSGTAQNYNIVVRDLAIDGNEANQNPGLPDMYGIMPRHVRGFKVINTYVHDFGRLGIGSAGYGNDVIDFSVIGNKVEDCGVAGIAATGVTGGIISDNYISNENTSGHGIYFEDNMVSIVIANNVIRDSFYGIWIADPSLNNTDINIANNVISGTKANGRGILVNPDASEIIIQGNLIHDEVGSAVAISGGDFISNNRIENFNQGIWPGNSAVVKGNYLNDVSYGLYPYDRSDCVFYDNYINSSWMAIRESAASGNNVYMHNIIIAGTVEIIGQNPIIKDNIGFVPPKDGYIVVASDAPIGTYGDFFCDGTADDVQIQAALDACPTGAGRVSLSEGTFNIGSTIQIPYGVMLEGAGIWQTTMSATSTLSSEMIFFNSAAVEQIKARGGGVKGMYIDCNDYATIGVRVRSTHYTFLEELHIHESTNHGLQIEATYGTYVQHVDIHECGGYGVNLCEYGGEINTAVRFENCEICQNTNYNMGITSGSAITIDSTWFENSAGFDATHLFVDNNESATPVVHVDKCTFTSFGDADLGILIQGGDVLIQESYIFGGGANDKTGLKITDGNLQFQNNHVTYWGNSTFGGQALDIDGGYGILISSNTFDGISTYSGNAIDVSGGISVNIIGNFIDGGCINNSANSVIIKDNNLYLVQETEDYAIRNTGSWVEISGNHINSCERTAIYVVTGSRIQITDNYIHQSGREYDNTYYAIWVGSDKVTVSNNMITSSYGNKPKYGIYVQGRTYCQISGNHVQDTATYDIYLSNGCEYCTVLDNICPNGKLSLASGIGNIYTNNVGHIVLDNDYIVAPSGTVEFADWYCDGTDDSVEIQCAIDNISATGGIIRFLSGTYYIDTTINVASNIHFIGAGNTTILQGVEAGSNPDLTIMFKIDKTLIRTNIRFSNMKLSCNGITNYRDMIRVWGATGSATYLYFDNIEMDYPRKGISTGSSEYVIIDNCRFTNGQYYMIYSYCGSDIIISNVYFDNCDVGTVITCVSTWNITINNVIAIDCQEQVIDISGISTETPNTSKYITINNVVAYNCGALLLAQQTANPNTWAEEVTVSNCVVYGAQSYSVIAGVYNHLTVNNLIIENTNHRKYMSLLGNHIYLDNIQGLTYGRDEGIKIISCNEFPALDDIKLSNIYIENVDPHPGDPQIYGYGNGIIIKSNATGGTGLQLSNIEIVGCEANGILIDNFSHVQLTNVISRGNGWNGIAIYNSTNVNMQGCIAINNSQGSSDSYDNFNFYAVDDSTVTNCISNGAVIKNDFCFDDTCGEFIFTDNIVSNSAIDFPSNTVGWIIRDNIGFVTENWGYNASVTNGFAIPHGLEGTPTIIIITPEQNTTVWITAKDGSTFTVGLPPGIYNIYWYAIYKP